MHFEYRNVTIVSSRLNGFENLGHGSEMVKGIKLVKNVFRLHGAGYLVSETATQLHVEEQEVRQILEE